MPRASAATGRERRGVHIVPALRVGQLVKMRQLNADDVVNAESTLPKLVSQQKNQNKQKKKPLCQFWRVKMACAYPTGFALARATETVQVEPAAICSIVCVARLLR